MRAHDRLPSTLAPISADSDSRVTYAHLQTGLERPLKVAATYTPSTTPWPKSEAPAHKSKAFAVPKRKKHDRAWGKGNILDRYGDSSSTAFTEEVGKKGTQSRREREWENWSPWPTSVVAGRPARAVSSHEMRPANRGENPWTSLGGPIKDKTLRPFRASEFFRTFFLFWTSHPENSEEPQQFAETELSFDFRAQFQELHKGDLILTSPSGCFEAVSRFKSLALRQRPTCDASLLCGR